MKKELQDLAWRSLPEEFKEKVMNLYDSFAISREFHEDKMENNSNEYWRCAASERLLEDLFGFGNINIHNKSKPKFKVGDFVHCKTPEEEGIYRVLRVYSGVNINYYDCRVAFTDKLFLYRFYESDLEPSIGPDTSHKQPDDENHPGDYSIYPDIDRRTAYGFLTRGCPNRCKWCVVPQKEGAIRPYQTIHDIAVDGRDHIILMDNNVLASEYGIRQIEEIVRLGLWVDFNQALDARLVTPEIADLLARVKWIKRIRFGCDTPAQIDECERAMGLIDRAGYRGEYFLYCILLDDFNESYRRVSHWRERGSRYIPHCQPYRDINNQHQVIPQWQRDMARWADRKELFRTCGFADYEPRKGFFCREYFDIYKQ